MRRVLYKEIKGKDLGKQDLPNDPYLQRELMEATMQDPDGDHAVMRVTAGENATPPHRQDPNLPRTRPAMKRWLLDQAQVLRAYDRGRFAREHAEPILDFLFTELQEDHIRQLALMDLRKRLTNEAPKIFNNFKTDQILKSLRRKFR